MFVAGWHPRERMGLDGTKTTWLKRPLICLQIPRAEALSTSVALGKICQDHEQDCSCGEGDRQLCGSSGRADYPGRGLQSLYPSPSHTGTTISPLVPLGALQADCQSHRADLPSQREPWVHVHPTAGPQITLAK